MKKEKDYEEQIKALGFGSLRDVATAHGLTYHQLRDRLIRQGWELKDALDQPVRKIIAETRAEKSSRRGAEEASGFRTCATCQQEHPIADYRVRPRSSGGRHRDCDQCRRYYRLLQSYNLDRPTYNAFYEAQDGRCYACKQVTEDFHVDHNHTTFQVRGLACPACNWTIGDFCDVPGRLRSAASWLSQHPGVPITVPKQRYGSRTGDDYAHYLWTRYRLTRADIEHLMKIQNESCGICHQRFDQLKKVENKAFTYTVDHIHDGTPRHERRRVIRGLLCFPCNKGLGHAKDSKILLLQLADVLESFDV